MEPQIMDLLWIITSIFIGAIAIAMYLGVTRGTLII